MRRSVLALVAAGWATGAVETCVDDPVLTKQYSSELTDSCAAVLAALGGVCSVHTPESQGFIDGNVISEESLINLFNLGCPKTCRVCMPRHYCYDKDDVAAASITISPGLTCAVVAGLNDGGCDRAGSAFAVHENYGISKLQLDTFIEACPLACGRCSPEPPCVDDDATAAAVHSGVLSCYDVVKANAYGCSLEGDVFGPSGTGSAGSLAGWSSAMTNAIIAACPRSCRTCVVPEQCRDFDAPVEKKFAQTCAEVLVLNGGTCAMDGAVFAIHDTLGIARKDIDKTIYDCPMSCGSCGPPPESVRPCIDDDLGATRALVLPSSCKQAFDLNNGGCEREQLYTDIIATTPMSTVDFMEGLATYCPQKCGYCKAASKPVVVPPDHIYVIQYKDLNMQGGDYELLNTSYKCDNYHMFKLKDHQFYIWSAAGTWHCGFDPTPNNVLTPEVMANANTANMTVCSNFTVTGRATATHNETVMPPDATWEASVGHLWLPTLARFQRVGCTGESMCLQENCLEPDDDYTCAQCHVEEARMVCEGNGSKTRTIVTVIVVVVCVVVVACNTVYIGGKETSTPVMPFKEQRRIRNPVAAVLIAYRRRVVHLMGVLGCNVAEYRVCFIASVLVLLITFACTGLPLIEVVSGQDKWVPTGTRVKRELEYTNKWTQEVTQSHNVIVMVGAENEGENAATAHHLEMLLKVMNVLKTVEVPIQFPNGTYGENIKYEDICQSLDNPVLETIMPGKKPCLNPSVLDCFYEGAWQTDDVSLGKPLPEAQQSALFKNLIKGYEVAQAVQEGQLSTYVGRPSFRNKTSAEILERFSRNLEGGGCHHWVVSSTLGRSQQFGSFVHDGIPKGRFNETGIVSVEMIMGLLRQYPAKRVKGFRKHMSYYDENEIEDRMEEWYDRVHDVLEDLNDDDVNFPNMRVSVYMDSSLKNMFEEIGESKLFTMFTGWLLMTGYVLLTQFSMDREKNHCVVGFLGMLIVACACLGGYGFVSLVGIKFNHTMLQALPFLALGLGVDDMFLLLHYYKGITNKQRPSREVISELFQNAGVSVTLTSFCNALSFFTGMIIPIPALRDFLASAGILCIFNYSALFLCFTALLSWECDRDRKIQETRTSEFDSDKESLLGGFSAQKLVQHYYSPFMQKAAVRLTITGINLALLIILSIMLGTVAPLNFGVDIVDLTPKGSFLSKGFSRTDHHIVVEHIDFPKKQYDMGKAFDEVRQGKYASEDVLKGSTWLEYFYVFGYLGGTLETRDPNKFYPGQFPGNLDLANFYYNESTFYDTFFRWRDPNSGLTAIASQLTDHFGYTWGMDNPTPGNKFMMVTCRYSLNMRLLDTPQDWLDHTDEMHDTLERFLGKDKAYPKPSGMYLTMQEFASLSRYFWTAIILATVVICISSLIIPVSLRGALLIAFTACASTIEVLAILMLADLSFSSLVAVALLIGMGISVEFSAHIVVGFEHATGSRMERLNTAICHTFIPVCEGGFSSILSFIYLAFSPFPYVFKYFFLVFLVVILVGLMHGLVFLPALIGLAGSTDAEEICSCKETEDVTTIMKSVAPAAQADTTPDTENAEKNEEVGLAIKDIVNGTSGTNGTNGAENGHIIIGEAAAGEDNGNGVEESNGNAVTDAFNSNGNGNGSLPVEDVDDSKGAADQKATDNA